MSLILPENYDPHMTVRETQEAIKYIRDTFQREFGKRNESGAYLSTAFC